MQTIIVVVEVDVPNDATKKEIQDFVDVTYGEVNGMSLDNKCRNQYEIYGATWTYGGSN